MSSSSSSVTNLRRVTKRKRTRCRHRKRGFVRKERLEEIDAELSSLIHATLEHEEEVQSREPGKPWLFPAGSRSDGPQAPHRSTYAGVPSHTGVPSHAQDHEPRPVSSQTERCGRPLRLLNDKSTQGSALIKWRPWQWSINTADDCVTIPRPPMDIQAPQRKRQWPNLEALHGE